VQFRLLGRVEIEANGELVSLPRRRTRCLLAILLLEVNRIVPVDRLARLLWEDNPPPGARSDIQGHISRLRGLLATGRTGAPKLDFAGDGYQLSMEPHAVDVHRFRDLLRRAAATTDLADRVEQLRAGLALWRGQALSNAASDWLRERLCADLEEQRLTAVEDLISACLALGQAREILPMVAMTAAAHPGRESLVALHMQALYQVGRRTDALELYARAREYLCSQMGLDPSPQLRELQQAILRDQLPAAAPPAPWYARVFVDQPASAVAPECPTVPRQLPADVAGFTGREAELARLTSLLVRLDQAPGTPQICAISGPAGVGKTALAVHWAHRSRDRFPDGQLYVNLRGYDPKEPPMSPEEAVRSFLDALLAPPARVPTRWPAQVGLYRSLLAEKRLLVVLDNARDAEQVRPLLPTTGGLALITSRDRMTGLVALAGATPLALDPLSPAESRHLLAHRLGAERVAAEPEAAQELVAACGGLPLALSILAARAAVRPHFPLATLAAELRDGDLEPWSGVDITSDLRTALSVSLLSLDDDAARLLCLLGLSASSSVSAAAAAGLAGLSLARTRRLLHQLTEASLLSEPHPDRYVLPDLLRRYARELGGSPGRPAAGGVERAEQRRDVVRDDQ